MTPEAHIGMLSLRKLRGGELAPQEANVLQVHAESCAECRGKLKSLDEEQRHFEEHISFERFSAGVTRAVRTSKSPSLSTRAAPWMAAAAAVFVVVVAGRFTNNPVAAPGIRSKGGAEVQLRIGGAQGRPQRTAAVEIPETLAAGERVRIGYEPGEHRYLMSVSVDEQGAVTALYPEGGRSLQVEAGADDLTYLPGSLEFTGRGAERVIVILSDDPLDVESVKRAAKSAFDASQGDLTRMPHLNVRGEQFHRTLLKP
jgi:hypothetical protein